MTQTIVTKPALQEKTCSVCPHFDNFHELKDNLALFPNVNFEELDVFPISKCPVKRDRDIPLGTEELEDELDKPHSEYEVGSIVKVINADEDYTEWAVFEVIECLHNKYIHDRHNPEAYLTHVDWYYRLVSHADGNTMPTNNLNKDSFLWVRENEICDFDLAHNVCTEEIF